MKNPRASKILMTLTVAGAVAAAVVWARGMVVPAHESSVAVTGRMFGPRDAAVKIVEYTDFQCPACANVSLKVHEALERNSPRISLEVKYFPLSMHKNARKAAQVAECAQEQGKFKAMHDVLFRSQTSWENLEDPSDYFLSLTRGLGMDDAAMMRCMTQSAVEARIDADVAEGKGRGVHATPTFFINGKMAVGGDNFEETLKEALR